MRWKQVRAWRLYYCSVFVLTISACGGGGESQEVPPDMADSHGSFDTIDKDVITGWAWDPEKHSQVKVDIYDGETLVETVEANKPRPDLRYKGGRFGFSLKTPKVFLDKKQHTVHAKVHGANIELHGSPKSFPLP